MGKYPVLTIILLLCLSFPAAGQKDFYSAVREAVTRQMQLIRSVQGIRSISVAAWQKEWTRIEARFARGEYVGHHSKAFEEAYTPHYRIISKLIFEKELQPLLDKAR